MKWRVHTVYWQYIGHFDDILSHVLCKLHNTMAESPKNARIAVAMDTLGAYGVVPGAAKTLRSSADHVARELQQAILAEVHA